MAFFKSDPSLAVEDTSEAENASKKLRYVIENGKGRWIRPLPPMPVDYDEDIDY